MWKVTFYVEQEKMPIFSISLPPFLHTKIQILSCSTVHPIDRYLGTMLLRVLCSKGFSYRRNGKRGRIGKFFQLLVEITLSSGTIRYFHYRATISATKYRRGNGPRGRSTFVSLLPGNLFQLTRRRTASRSFVFFSFVRYLDGNRRIINLETL